MVLSTREGRALVPGPLTSAGGGGLKTIVVTYKGMVIKDISSPFVKRASAGDVATVSDDDATLLIGMGRAKLYEPPKEPPKTATGKEPEKEPKRESQSAAPKHERKKE